MGAGRASSLAVDSFPDDERDRWCVFAVDASSGGPPSRALIERLAHVLASDARVQNLRWHRRESHFGFGQSAPDAATPFDARSSSD